MAVSPENRAGWSSPQRFQEAGHPIASCFLDSDQDPEYAILDVALGEFPQERRSVAYKRPRGSRTASNRAGGGIHEARETRVVRERGPFGPHCSRPQAGLSGNGLAGQDDKT